MLVIFYKGEKKDGSFTEVRPSGEDRGESGRRTWYEL